MRKTLAVLLALGLHLSVSPSAIAGSTAVAAQPVATGLAFPAAFAFTPDGRIFYGERFTGEIRLLDPVSGQDTLFFTLPDVATAGEQGLLGLAVHFGYPRKAFVYAYYTRTVAGSPQNQIVRLKDAGGTGASLRTLHTLPASGNHNGGVIHFGPDRMLYAVVGDVQSASNAQNLSSEAGKVLRMDQGGRVPRKGNPFPNSRVYSYGHRNMFGFDWDPVSGKLFLSENGPQCNDEANLVLPGGNYGWGTSWTCSSPPPAPQNTNQDGPNPVMPLVFYTPTIAPTGAAFCDGCGLGTDTEDTLLMGAWNDGIIRRLTLNADRTAVVAQDTLYDHPSGVLAVESGPDGSVYFSSSSAIYKLATS